LVQRKREEKKGRGEKEKKRWTVFSSDEEGAEMEILPIGGKKKGGKRGGGNERQEKHGRLSMRLKILPHTSLAPTAPSEEGDDGKRRKKGGGGGGKGEDRLSCAEGLLGGENHRVLPFAVVS